MSGADLAVKGWIAVIFGLTIAMIGIDELTAWHRLTFNSPELTGGLPFIPIMIGFFGIPQVVEALSAEQDVLVAALDKSKTKPVEVSALEGRPSVGARGVGMGVSVPGIGEDVAA